MSIDHSTTIKTTCQMISEGDIPQASRFIASHYPFIPQVNSGRNYTPRVMTGIFLRDGFIDRYRGIKLVFPPVLRLLSHYLPNEFPYHKHGKMSEGHIAYWELFPTIDHIVPVARGGTDSDENWVCCSMLTNSIKSNWTLEQMQWKLLPKGDIAEWDGMLNWFIRQVELEPNLLNIPYIKRWYSSAVNPQHYS
jgi:hypothetical protein